MARAFQLCQLFSFVGLVTCSTLPLRMRSRLALEELVPELLCIVESFTPTSSRLALRHTCSEFLGRVAVPELVLNEFHSTLFLRDPDFRCRVTAVCPEDAGR